MRKDSKGSGRAKIRVFFAEIEGDNDTLREGLQSIASAVNRTFQPQTVVKTLPQSSSQGGSQEDTESEDTIDAELDEDNSDSDDEPTKSSSNSTRPRKKPTYSIVSELNLIPENKESFKDFYQKKNAKEQQQKITVVVYYLHKILEIESITSHHVYTCLKDVKERIPPDIGGVIRTTANRKGWIDSSDSDNLKITTIGENFVEHDLPITE